MKRPSEMTDTELNRAMAWLYPPKQTCINDNGIHLCFIGIKGVGYLQDWNLTMPLAFREDITISFSPDCTYSEYHEVLDDIGNEILFNAEVKGGGPLRSICEVLVQIGMEKAANSAA